MTLRPPRAGSFSGGVNTFWMSDAPQDVVPGNRCPQCDTPADDGLIFCKSCGAALRTPLTLTQSLAQDEGSPSKPKSLPRKIFVLALKGLAGIAAVVALLCQLGTFLEILVFGASVAMAFLCYAVLTNLDETHVDEYGNNGYWPKPLDWNASAKTQALAKEDTAAR